MLQLPTQPSTTTTLPTTYLPLTSAYPPHTADIPPYFNAKMGRAPTKTVKNKHATKGSGIKNSKAARRPEADPVVKAKKSKDGRAPVKPGQLAKDLQKKKKKKVYSEKELGIPELNMVTPVGVEKPKGKKKGKVFVDDRVRCATPTLVSHVQDLRTCIADVIY